MTEKKQPRIRHVGSLPSDAETSRIYIRLKAETRAALEKLAQERRMPFSYLARDILEQATKT